jgi:hypothetical protein
MSSAYTPRLDYVDVETESGVLESVRTSVLEELDWIRDKPNQMSYSVLWRYYSEIAVFSYALGLPLAEVRESLANAARTFLKVLELRGTGRPFPAYTLTYDPNYPPGHPDAVVEFKSLRAENARDYSVTNSRDNYVAVCQALIAGEDQLADHLASLVWDPPDASYIGPRSFCTPNQQRVAYALRHLMSGDAAAADSELKGVRRTRRDISIRHEAAMVRAIVENARDVFTEALAALLDWTRREGLKRDPYNYSDFFISIVGLGLARLAVRRGICAIKDLPRENPLLPIDLISEVKDEIRVSPEGERPHDKN